MTVLKIETKIEPATTALYEYQVRLISLFRQLSMNQLKVSYISRVGTLMTMS